ncbi:MAG: hypothetical protein ACKON9_24880, partial [Planctomycetaceae bacterium]
MPIQKNHEKQELFSAVCQTQPLQIRNICCLISPRSAGTTDSKTPHQRTTKIPKSTISHTTGVSTTLNT